MQLHDFDIELMFCCSAFYVNVDFGMHFIVNENSISVENKVLPEGSGLQYLVTSLTWMKPNLGAAALIIIAINAPAGHMAQTQFRLSRRKNVNIGGNYDKDTHTGNEWILR